VKLPESTQEHWIYDDGGRADAGYRGKTGDCGVRAIAIATGLPYQEVYWAINEFAKKERLTRRHPKRSNSRTGIHPKTMHRFFESIGWQWTPTMTIGSGTTVHLTAGELPAGRLVVRCSKHYTAMIDGLIHDTYDPSRDGTRAVYGYWSKGAGKS
jgi:hypothetical protein